MQPSASKTALLLQCAWPFAADRELEPNEPGEAAIKGTKFHLAIAQLLLGQEPTEGDPEILAHARRSHIYLVEWLTKNDYGPDKAELLVETSFAYDPVRAKARIVVLDEATHTYVGLKQSEIAGTADLIAIPHDNSRPILVLDHKTGAREDYSRPERLPQLVTLGLMAVAYAPARGADDEPVIPAVLHAPFSGIPIVYEGQPLHWDRLKNHQLAVLEQLRRIGDGSMRPGPECHYCPARGVCPTRNAELLEQAGELVERANLVGSELVLVSGASMLSKEERIGRLHLLMTRFRELDKRASQEIKMEMEADPLLEPIRPDGKRLVLEERHAEYLTKKSVLEALGKEAGERKLEELRQLGCMSTSDTVSLRAK